MKRIWLPFFTVMIIFFLLLVPASADYLFKVPRAETTVIVNRDGTLTLEYTYEFINILQPLDFIDIGTPNSTYNLTEITVLLNGEADQNIKVTKADQNYPDWFME